MAFIVILALFSIAVLGMLTLTTGVVNQARNAAMIAGCVGHLTQLKLALDSYAAAYGCFPLASTTDLDGTPIHSWRVVCLHTSKEHSVNGLYDLNVPWNHANNASLLNDETAGDLWWCPSGDGRATKMTDYVAVVGSETAWPGDRGLKRSEIIDDPASTVLVLEVAGSRIHWMEPKDPTLDEVLSSGLSSHHSGFVNALFADGRVRRIRTDVSPEALKALLTVSGGEPLDAASWKWNIP
jgi:prepilin-type processing-associated H-X9-DG protein